MTDIENLDSTLDIADDGPDDALKKEESIKRKYFNGGQIHLTKLDVPKRNKSQMINVKKPLVSKRKRMVPFTMLAVMVVSVILLGCFLYFLKVEE